MLKFAVGAAVVAMSANLALAATNVDVRVGVPAPPLPSVHVQVGHPAPPPPMVVERETVIIKEKGDQGKHKGHYKHKKEKKHKKHED